MGDFGPLLGATATFPACAQPRDRHCIQSSLSASGAPGRVAAGRYRGAGLRLFASALGCNRCNAWLTAGATAPAGSTLLVPRGAPAFRVCRQLSPAALYRRLELD